MKQFNNGWLEAQPKYFILMESGIVYLWDQYIEKHD
jgi:hypothetical protein